jgi:catechol 2,3-dioxygenase-like lactoylglutathione lyase family enzyme
VVEDLDATEAFLRDQFGVTAWVRLEGIEFGPDNCTYRGAPADFAADISLSYAGDLQLELIRPVGGESIYTEFLATHGPGLHHVCFETDDLAAALHGARSAGLEVVQQGSMAGGAMEFAYIDGAAAGAPYIEVVRIGPDMRAFFTDIKEQVS